MIVSPFFVCVCLGIQAIISRILYCVSPFQNLSAVFHAAILRGSNFYLRKDLHDIIFCGSSFLSFFLPHHLFGKNSSKFISPLCILSQLRWDTSGFFKGFEGPCACPFMQLKMYEPLQNLPIY